MTGIHDEHNFDTRLQNLAQGEQDAQIERHVASCESCQDALFTLRQLFQYRTTTGGSLAEPPVSLLTRISELFSRVRPDLIASPSPPTQRQLFNYLRQITAELIHDSEATPQLAGLRSSGNRRTHQLAFVSEVADLDLEVSPQKDGWSVSGQLGMDIVPAELHIRFVPTDQDLLAENPEGIIETVISDQGYFDLRITEGEWVATVDIDDTTVLFRRIRV